MRPTEPPDAAPRATEPPDAAPRATEPPDAAPRATAPLAGRNPVAKLAAVLALTIGLLATLDPLTPAVSLAVEVAVVPLFGVRYWPLLRRAWPLLVSAASVALVQVLFGAGPDRWVAALGLGLRVLAVGLPGVVVLTTIDATDLADALIGNLGVPPRFAIGALAAFRLLPLLGEDWRNLRLARRARGVDAGHNPLAALRLLAGATFALLVAAIRRGTRLATAMDARGFDGAALRTSARGQRFTRADTALVAGAVLIAVAALLASVATGLFRPVF